MVGQTQVLFEKLYGAPVSEEDAKEIIKNVSEFFLLLNAWNRKAAGDHSDEKQPA